LSFGIQLRLGFGAARVKSAVRPETKNNPQVVLATVALSDEQQEIMERAVVFGLFNETALPEMQKKHLDEVADILKKHPAIRISITGHTCNNDAEAEDKKTGIERARSVAQYLQSRAIDPSRMDVNAAPESDVFEPFNPDANYQSRRVVIRVE
jgi:outer membrane protein OmpA-like peptidoglycan-associated protein